MKTAKLAPLWILLSATAGGCGLTSFQADIPDVEVTQRGLAFEGVPLAGLIGDVSVSRSFSQQHQKLDLPAGIDSEVKALGVSLVAKSGVQDFSFIHNLRVTMSDNVHPPVQLLEYQQTPGATPSGTLDMVSANPVNTLDHWKTDSATFIIDVAGSLPAQPWTVDLRIHFGGSLKYKL
jgi:hypothetical protein